MRGQSNGNRNSMLAADKENSDQYHEELPNVIGEVQSGCRSICTKSNLIKRLPIFDWLPKYKASYLLRDLIAGLTVGLTAIPQGIAYGVVSGLGPQYGLYAAFMGSFTYIVLGTCKDITIGPTAIMALMVQQYVTISPDFAILACFLTGCVITLFGILNFGFLVQFISVPVTQGFTTAAALTIASGQINTLFGILSKSNGFIGSWLNVFDKILDTRFTDLGLGIGIIVLLVLLRKCNDIRGNWKMFGKYLSLSRNALAVIIAALIAYITSLFDMNPFQLIGDIRSGIPSAQLPPFKTVDRNGTDLGFSEMTGILGSSLIAIPVVSILDTIAIANSFAGGKSIDASQEMIALGLCNIAGSFFSSMPITGSFTRTAVNSASGVMTPLGGVFTGAVVLLGLGLLTKVFYFIPKSALSAIIIMAMYHMIHVDEILCIWRAKRVDILPFLLTLFTCLFIGLELGILSGIILSVMFILYETARPDITFEARKIEGQDILMVKPSGNLIFSSANHLKKRVIETVHEIEADHVFIIIDGESIKNVDSTVAMQLKSMRDDLISLKCVLVFWNWKRKTASVLWRLSKEFRKNFYYGIEASEIFDSLIRNKIDENDDTQLISVGK